LYLRAHDMSLLAPHNHHSYFVTNGSVGAGAGTAAGTTITSSASANTYGTWTQIHAGLTYGCDYLVVRINAMETSADVISSTTLNAYIDIGVGATDTTVMTVIEKLGGSQAQGLGVLYFIPVRFPPDTPVWARHQNTAGSARCGVQVSWFGGNMNPYNFPSFTGMVALGAVTASTTGTAVTPNGAGAEGAWAQIVSSTTDDYGGVMVSPLFNVDTSLTSGLHTTIDVGIGASGQEKVIGENLTQQFIWATTEPKDAVCFPSFVGVAAGSRLCARASGSNTADGTNTVIIYGFKH
jgi:hypothetical protein